MSLANGFEHGTNGSNVTTAAGEADPQQWDAINNAGSGNTIVYDNTNVANGSLACKLNNPTNAAECNCSWTTQFGTQTEHYGRAYFWCAGNAGNFTARLVTAGAASVRLTSAGKLQITNSGTQVGVSTNSVNASSYFRVEWHIIHSATVGQIEAKLFNSPSSTTPTETVTSAANLNTGASSTSILIGLGGGSGVTQTLWQDGIVAAAASYPGPIASASTSNLALSYSGGQFLKMKGIR